MQSAGIIASVRLLFCLRQNCCPTGSNLFELFTVLSVLRLLTSFLPEVFTVFSLEQFPSAVILAPQLAIHESFPSGHNWWSSGAVSGAVLQKGSRFWTHAIRGCAPLSTSWVTGRTGTDRGILLQQLRHDEVFRLYLIFVFSKSFRAAKTSAS